MYFFMFTHTFFVINQIWGIILCCIPFHSMVFCIIHSQHFVCPSLFNQNSIPFFRYITFSNRSLKLICNKINTCLNLFTNILSRPKLSLEYIQIFHYFYHIMYFGHVREFLKNRSGFYQMDYSDINHEQYFFRAWHYFLFCCCFVRLSII